MDWRVWEQSGRGCAEEDYRVGVTLPSPLPNQPELRVLHHDSTVFWTEIISYINW